MHTVSTNMKNLDAFASLWLESCLNEIPNSENSLSYKEKFATYVRFDQFFTGNKLIRHQASPLN